MAEKEPKYVCLKLDKLVSIRMLKDLLTDFEDNHIFNDEWFYWRDIVELLFKAEGQKDPKLYEKFEVKKKFTFEERSR